MIKLYYIRGINEYDTPYFENKAKQNTYFESKVVKSIGNSYYPPKYHNSIVLAIDDVELNTKVNYLSLYFRDKYYYFFIDNITYINASEYSIDITMDVIQTYMFDIDFIHSQVSRRLIDRWNNNHINRKYLREDISQGIFQMSRYEEIPYKNPMLVVQSTKSYKKALGTQSSAFNIDNKMLIDGIYYYMQPYIISRSEDNLTFNCIGSDNVSSTSYGLRGQTALIKDLPDVQTAYVSFYNNVNVTITETSTNRTYKFNDSSFGLDEFTFVQVDYFNINETPINYVFNFTRNTEINAPFTVTLCPQLLDENYIQFKWGERLGATTFPLSKMANVDLYLYGITDYLTGNRTYKITTTQTGEDKYQTSITNMTQENILLVNDAFKNYLANYKGTLMMGMAKASLNLALTTIAKPVAPMIKYTPKRHQISAKSQRALDRYNKQMFNYNTTRYLETAEMGGGEEILNTIFRPDTTKQGNAVTSDILANALRRYYSIEQVTDIEDVAKILEGYGYKVHENYNNENLFNILNTRYYYNVIQCDDIDISLNLLNDDTTISRIIDRFTNGIRLWNVDNGDIAQYLYIYDNVEKSFIEGGE